MQRGWRAAAVAAVLGLGGAAGAHELKCEKLMGDGDELRVSSYPATIEVRYLVYNAHPTETSVAQSAEDPLLAPYGFRFTPVTPLAIPVGGWSDSSFLLTIDSYEDCLDLAARDGREDDNFDSTFRVTWPLGETQCGARLICGSPIYTDDCELNPESCPVLRGPTTRDEGFFKTHEKALGTCLASGPVDLGALGQVRTPEQALGLLWGSPLLYENGEPRTQGDALRFDVGRQQLVATCNERLFGAQPPRAAKAALAGNDCGALSGALKALQGFNASGTKKPVSVDAGPSTPVHARTVADDFTRPSGLDCAGGSR